VSYALAELSIAMSARRVLAPATLVAFAVIGLYAYRPNPVQASFSATALLTALFTAWLVAAVEREVGATAQGILTVRSGGAVGAWRGRILLVLMLSAAVTVFAIVWPVATGAFDRTPGLGDLLAAALGHFVIGTFGGMLALLLGAPVRMATSFAVVLLVVLGSLALTGALGVFAGPGGAAHALEHTPRDRVSLDLALACGLTAVESAGLAYAARRQSRWRG
jgi:hypothetical protein